MSPDPQVIIGAAARLDAGLRRLFHPDPFAFTVTVPVQVWDDEGGHLRTVPPAAATKWAAFAGPDPLPEPLGVMTERVAGLDAVRRPLIELANQVEQLRSVAGAAAVVVQLFGELAGAKWGDVWVPHESDPETIRITNDEGGDTWIYKSLILFTPPNVLLLALLIDAAKSMPATVVPTPAATASRPARNKRGSDTRTDTALKLYEQLRREGLPVAEAERIVIEQTGQWYESGSMAGMLRVRKRKARARAMVAEAKAA